MLDIKTILHASNIETPASWRIEPYKITNYERTKEEIESFACFVPAVAGKKATMISNMIFNFFAGCGHDGSPFERIRNMLAEGTLDKNLRRAHLGKYNVLHRCYAAAATAPDLDLFAATPERLERLCGYGMKSSRFLILHSQRNARVAVIDTHILKFLRAIGVNRVPDTIPTGKDYLRLEDIILEEADRLGLAIADFDLQVWTWYARGNQGMPEFVRDSDKLPSASETLVA